MIIVGLLEVVAAIQARPTECIDRSSCPTAAELREAAHQFDRDRLETRLNELYASAGPNGFVAHPVFLSWNHVGLKDIHCVNEDNRSTARCSFDVDWGNRDELFIADLQRAADQWKIVDAKSIVADRRH